MYKIYSDGCHLKEFNVAGVGGYLEKDGIAIFELSEKIDSELLFMYHEKVAIKTMLEKALELGIENETIEFYCDEDALMRILGSKNRNDYIKDSLFKEICDLSDQFTDINFHYLPRSENKKADKLSRKKIIDELFTEKQIVSSGYFHEKWISKNNYPKDDTREFNKEKEHIFTYLVIHIFVNQKNKTNQADIYYAHRNQNDSEVSYEFKESINKSKGWQKIIIETIAEHLKIMAEKEKNIGFVLHDEIVLMDKLFRGRQALSVNQKKSFDKLNQSLELLDKVIVHREPLIYEKIFNDDPTHMKPKLNQKP